MVPRIHLQILCYLLRLNSPCAALSDLPSLGQTTYLGVTVSNEVGVITIYVYIHALSFSSKSKVWLVF
jgi:hypothetical protein